MIEPYVVACQGDASVKRLKKFPGYVAKSRRGDDVSRTEPMYASGTNVPFGIEEGDKLPYYRSVKADDQSG